MIRNIAFTLINMYLGAGMFAAALLGAAIPALNAVGYTYIMLTWPKIVYCAPKHRGCSSYPDPATSKYFFTFKDKP